jgi:hypothetical protein
VFDRINVPGFDGPGVAVQTGGDVADLTIEHNTFIVTAGQSPLLMVNDAMPRFRYANNIATRGSSGVFGSNGPGQTLPEGSASLAGYAPDGFFSGNAIIGAQASLYPVGNYFPATIDATGFVDPTGWNWRLTANSPLKGGATDNRDPGADITVLEAATQGVAAH